MPFFEQEEGYADVAVCARCGQTIDLRLSGGAQICQVCVMRQADEQVDRDVEDFYGE